MILEQTEIKYRGKIIFERLVMSTKFKRVPKFFTEDEACFLYLTKGAFHFRTPTNFLTFNEGDGMLSKCGNYFIENVSITENTEHQVISAIGAFFYPTMVKEFFQTDLSIEQFQNNFDTVKISIEPLMKSFIDSINYMLDNPKLANENLIITKLKELLLLLSKTEKSNSINAFVNSLFVTNEYNLNEIIQQNLYSNLALPELAHLSNMSLATFKRKFTSFYSESPAKYILQKKLEKSMQLLGHKSKSISEIAYECGFETISNFDKAFKKQFQKSPTDFRLSQKDK
ncbi:helix-turn-helix domain-containing protein [Ferruginibacter sp.]|nr:helix-turn-helix transcriptional regulator [Ferruginibacter sp.]